MTYRDRFERCPRCHVELVDARSARACRNCSGMWLTEDVVTDMVLEMVPPGMFGRLVLQPHPGPRDDRLACPSCEQAMERVAMHGVPIDRCAAHGIWFDPEELQQALRRCADASARSLDPRGAPRAAARAQQRESAPPPPTPAPTAAAADGLRFRVRGPDGSIREVVVEGVIVKIGRAANAHVAIADPAAARLHAVIDASDPAEIVIIDLGSEAGTTVNGERLLKRSLASGDVIGIGATSIEVTIPDDIRQ